MVLVVCGGALVCNVQGDFIYIIRSGAVSLVAPADRSLSPAKDVRRPQAGSRHVMHKHASPPRSTDAPTHDPLLHRPQVQRHILERALFLRWNPFIALPCSLNPAQAVVLLSTS